MDWTGLEAPESLAPEPMNENEIQEEPFVFRALNESDLTDLLFPDRLVIYTKSQVPAGDFQISFKIARLSAQTAIRVEIKTEGVLAGVPSGTRVSALLDLSLHTLHEECSEYLELPGARVVERRWTMQRDSDSSDAIRWSRYSRRSPPSSEPWRSDACLEVAAAEAVIGEASAFLLQRILVLRPVLLGITETQPLSSGRRWRVLTVDRDGALRPGSFTWLGAGAEEKVAVLRTLGERQIVSWFDRGGRLVQRQIKNWPVELRAVKGEEEEERRAIDPIVERRSSVAPSGCFCGFVTNGSRSRSARSQRQ